MLHILGPINVFSEFSIVFHESSQKKNSSMCCQVSGEVSRRNKET